jgi:hypothetical protein
MPPTDHAGNTCRALRSIVEISLAAWARGGMAARGARAAAGADAADHLTPHLHPSADHRDQSEPSRRHRGSDVSSCSMTARGWQSAPRRSPIPITVSAISAYCARHREVYWCEISTRAQALLMRHARFCCHVRIENAWCGFGAYFPVASRSVLHDSATSRFDRNCQNIDGTRLFLVLPVRIELTTSPLPRGCSTTELRQRRAGCENHRWQRPASAAILAIRPDMAQARALQ